MQIHKGHDQDIFGLMGKDTKIFSKFILFDSSFFRGILLNSFIVMFSSLITFLLLCNIGCCIYNRNEDKLKYCDKYLPTSCIPRQRLSTTVQFVKTLYNTDCTYYPEVGRARSLKSKALKKWAETFAFSH